MLSSMNESAKGTASLPPTLEERLRVFSAQLITPRWIKDIFRFLPVKSQFVLSGNARDRYPFPRGEGFVPMNLTQYLAETLTLAGYEHFIAYHPTTGFSPVVLTGGNPDIEREFFKETFKMAFNKEGFCSCDLNRSLDHIEAIVQHREHFVAIFADFASRFVIDPSSLNEREHGYFTRALVLSQEAQSHLTEGIRFSQFNAFFWICDKENDLPDWFTLNNPRLRSIVISKPDHLARRALITALTPSIEGYSTASESQREESHTAFVEQTEGLLMTDVIAITQLCRREKLPLQEIGEAVRRYKVGVTEDPWKRIDRAKIAGGENLIRKRVKGQNQAVIKSLDIVKRAVTGLSGSQGSKAGGKPRGVLFFAGPTGVGKTELAKTLTELLFGDERAYIRFDMSEFGQEHADQRLIGAPPGYVGYDAGGQLTNAIRERPFSVVLFDEIEKAHPRILDKFLQILDDGVLTSGRGEQVYFSESVIIFTSNLGIYRLDPATGDRVLHVRSDEPYAIVEKKVRDEIVRYFKIHLNRPEILNRIGENIVVFDFIRRDVGEQIFDKMLANILEHLQDRQKISVTLPDVVKDVLREHCLADLSNGGRGIGNQIEAWFINPLGRALFDANVAEGASITIQAIEAVEGVPTVKTK